MAMIGLLGLGTPRRTLQLGCKWLWKGHSQPSQGCDDMRITFVEGAREEQTGQNQCNRLVIGQTNGCLVEGAVDAKGAIFLPERHTLLGKEIQVTIYRAAVDL
jgi:hypothetical protein